MTTVQDPQIISASKSPVQSKTLWLNGLAMLVALVQYYQGPLPTVDTHSFSVAVGGIGAANFILRFFTHKGIV